MIRAPAMVLSVWAGIFRSHRSHARLTRGCRGIWTRKTPMSSFFRVPRIWCPSCGTTPASGFRTSSRVIGRLQASVSRTWSNAIGLELRAFSPELSAGPTRVTQQTCSGDRSRRTTSPPGMEKPMTAVSLTPPILHASSVGSSAKATTTRVTSLYTATSPRTRRGST